MKPVGIITDSCSGISQKEASERGIFVLPMPFYIEGHCLYEGVDLDRDEFLEKLKGRSRRLHLPAVSGGGDGFMGPGSV